MKKSFSASVSSDTTFPLTFVDSIEDRSSTALMDWLRQNTPPAVADGVDTLMNLSTLRAIEPSAYFPGGADGWSAAVNEAVLGLAVATEALKQNVGA